MNQSARIVARSATVDRPITQPNAKYVARRMHEKLLDRTPLGPLETSRYILGNYSPESNVRSLPIHYR